MVKAQHLWDVAIKMNSSIDSTCKCASIYNLKVALRSKAYYQRGHKVHYSGFKLATSTFVLSILMFILIATSHSYCAFTNNLNV